MPLKIWTTAETDMEPAEPINRKSRLEGFKLKIIVHGNTSQKTRLGFLYWYNESIVFYSYLT